MNNQTEDHYDINGFKIAVSGPARAALAKEFSYFKTADCVGGADLRIKLSRDLLPTSVLRGTAESIKLPLGDSETEFLYTSNVPHLTIVAFTEALMYWRDKVIIHASVVAKGGRAYLFCGPENSGKTSAALNLVKKGYEYFSDDWSIIGQGQAYPFPKTIHVYPYNLTDQSMAKRIFGPMWRIYRKWFALVSFIRKHSHSRIINIIIDRHPFYYEVPVTTLYPGSKIGKSTKLAGVFYLDRKVGAQPQIKSDISATELSDRMSHFTYFEKWHLINKEYARRVVLTGQRTIQVEKRLEHDAEIMKKTFEQIPLRRLVMPTDYNLSVVDLERWLGL